jgi:hypothetical protein
MHATQKLPLVTLLLVAAGALAAACDDSTTPAPPEPEVATLRLVIGGSDTVSVDVATGVVTGAPITIAATTAFVAEFLLANGQPEPLVTDAEFRLDVVPADLGVVTFSRTSAFAGTLNKVAAGATTINFALYHLVEMHNEFDRPVAITVN